MGVAQGAAACQAHCEIQAQNCSSVPSWERAEARSDDIWPAVLALDRPLLAPGALAEGRDCFLWQAVAHGVWLQRKKGEESRDISDDGRIFDDEMLFSVVVYI